MGQKTRLYVVKTVWRLCHLRALNSGDVYLLRKASLCYSLMNAHNSQMYYCTVIIIVLPCLATSARPPHPTYHTHTHTHTHFAQLQTRSRYLSTASRSGSIFNRGTVGPIISGFGMFFFTIFPHLSLRV